MEMSIDPFSLPQEASCASCRFYRRISADRGKCRFNPPVVVQDGDSYSMELPFTQAGDLCGQWVPRPSPRAQQVPKVDAACLAPTSTLG